MTRDTDDAEATGSEGTIEARIPFGSNDREVDRTVEPGSPTLEHALFVLLGAIATLAVFLHAVGVL